MHSIGQVEGGKEKMGVLAQQASEGEIFHNIRLIQREPAESEGMRRRRHGSLAKSAEGEMCRATLHWGVKISLLSERHMELGAATTAALCHIVRTQEVRERSKVLFKGI